MIVVFSDVGEPTYWLEMSDVEYESGKETTVVWVKTLNVHSIREC